MSAYELYYISGSPPCWRAMLAMAVKGLDYLPRRLDNSKQEQKSPEFLRVNPKGTVPVLVGDGLIIRESMAIMAYLDAKYPEPPLFGRTPAETAAIWQEIYEFEAEFPGPARAISRPLFRGKAQEAADEIGAAADDMRDILKALDNKLTQQSHIAGDFLSAADIGAYPVLMAIARACGREDAQFLDLKIAPFSSHTPNVAAWVGRMEALPGHDDAYPPHWRQAAE